LKTSVTCLDSAWTMSALSQFISHGEAPYRHLFPKMQRCTSWW